MTSSLVDNREKHRLTYALVVILYRCSSDTRSQMVKQYAEPFIIDKRELDIWSNDYFLQLADMMVL